MVHRIGTDRVAMQNGGTFPLGKKTALQRYAIGTVNSFSRHKR